MKKIIAVFLLSLSLLAGYVDELERYLLQKSFDINGLFFVDGKKWLFGLYGENGKIVGVYELLGVQPTKSNPFGWKRVPSSSVNAQEAGYFVYIDFPLDRNSSDEAFSWLYIDKKEHTIYKLMGSKDGYFHYLDENNDSIPDPIPLYYRVQDRRITFYDCRKSVGLHDGSLTFEKLWKSSGKVGYGCNEEWNLSKGSSLQNIEIVEILRGDVNGRPFIGSIVKDFASATVSIEGLVGGNYVVCTQRYEPAKLSQVQDLKKLMEEWGNEEVKAQSCNLPFVEARSFDLDIERVVTIKEANQTSRTYIYEKAIKR